jgi:serine/threonine protein kinase
MVTGDFVAIKKVEKSRLNSKTTNAVRGEVALLRTLDHKCILRIFDCVETDENLCLVLEFMENGSLASVLDKFGPLPEVLVISYLHQILIGLQYLHEHGVLHRDIKAANILINKDGDIKVADFGVAEQINKDASARYSVVGTPYWMAPEVIEMHAPTAASDIWAVGATIIEMLSSKPPYFDMSPISAIFRIVQDPHPPIPANLSENMSNIIMQCFTRDSTKRPTAAQLLKHPIFLSTEVKNISYADLTDTLRTMQRTKRVGRFRPSVYDWFAAAPSTPETRKQENPQNQKHVVRSQEQIIKGLQDDLKKEKEAAQQRDSVIRQLTAENEELQKKLAQYTNKNPEDFYRDYFITMAMSFKMNMIAKHKECRVNINALMELAQEEKVPIHELVDWIPGKISKKKSKHSSYFLID